MNSILSFLKHKSPKIKFSSLLLMLIFFSCISFEEKKPVLSKVMKGEELLCEFIYGSDGKLLNIIDDLGKVVPNLALKKDDNSVFDNQNRLVYNKYKTNSVDVYENILKYNNEGFLDVAITKRSLVNRKDKTEELFFVVTKKYFYDEGLLSKLETKGVNIFNNEVEYEEVYELFYNEETFKDNNFKAIMYESLLPMSIPSYQIKGFCDKNRLIKTVLHTVDDYKTIYNYNYGYDEKKNVVNMKVKSNNDSYNYQGEKLPSWQLNYQFYYSYL